MDGWDEGRYVEVRRGRREEFSLGIVIVKSCWIRKVRIWRQREWF